MVPEMASPTAAAAMLATTALRFFIHIPLSGPRIVVDNADHPLTDRTNCPEVFLRGCRHAQAVPVGGGPRRSAGVVHVAAGGLDRAPRGDAGAVDPRRHAR